MAGDAQPVSYVPFRNQLFNTIGCAYAEAKGADTVWYGAAEVDSLAGYWDGSNEFVSNGSGGNGATGAQGAQGAAGGGGGGGGSQGAIGATGAQGAGGSAGAQGNNGCTRWSRSSRSWWFSRSTG